MALVLIIVLVLIVVKVTGSNSSSSSGGNGYSPASATVVYQVTHVPDSVYNKVGITSSATQIYPPVVLQGQPHLTSTKASGGSSVVLPRIYAFLAEFCPYCAATNWAIITSLSRFGTFHGLGNMESRTNDVDPDTQTFTFRNAKFDSPYVVFTPQEYVNRSGDILQNYKGDEKAIVTKYDTSTYVSGLSSEDDGTFPFLDFGNQLLGVTLYSPDILQNLPRETIAGGLTDPANTITQAIIASSNYVSAATCHITGQQPASVCMSKGVTAADKALKLAT